MAATWAPQPEGLAELLGLFRDSQSPEQATQIRIAHVRDHCGSCG
jgi:hypothetical protein